MTYVITTVGAALAALFGYLGVRFTSHQATVATSAMDAAEWERRYRSNAEKHLQWDLMIQQRVMDLERKVGSTLDPVPAPPPLFPDPPEGSS